MVDDLSKSFGGVRAVDRCSLQVREIPTWRESRRFSDAERVALEYAEAMTITGQRVSDELFARLKGSFDEAQIVELTAAVALENFRSKFNVPLGIEAQGFCALPGLPPESPPRPA